MIAPPARVVVVNAWFTLVTRSWSVPGSWPMNTSDAMSSVNSLTAGWNRKRGSLVAQLSPTTWEATRSMCST
jgi:hypothetical protein